MLCWIKRHERAQGAESRKRGTSQRNMTATPSQAACRFILLRITSLAAYSCQLLGVIGPRERSSDPSQTSDGPRFKPRALSPPSLSQTARSQNSLPLLRAAPNPSTRDRFGAPLCWLPIALSATVEPACRADRLVPLQCGRREVRLGRQARLDDGCLRHAGWLHRHTPPLGRVWAGHSAHSLHPRADRDISSEQVVGQRTAHVVVALSTQYVVALVVFVDVLEVARVPERRKRPAAASCEGWAWG